MTDRRRPVEQPHEGAGGSDLVDLPDIVARIVDTMRAARLESIVISKGDFHLELKSMNSSSPPGTSDQSGGRIGEEDAGDGESDDGIHVITSPMIGTFYAAPAPGEPPFIRPGDTVVEGQTIAIVEAMKIMNEIAADRSGTVVEIVAEDAETVEYGSPLVRLQIQS
ncbi:acetyl-CoA carboxylase biotin carboxyl carrier protein [soil metagenome]